MGFILSVSLRIIDSIHYEIWSRSQSDLRQTGTLDPIFLGKEKSHHWRFQKEQHNAILKSIRNERTKVHRPVCEYKWRTRLLSRRFLSEFSQHFPLNECFVLRRETYNCILKKDAKQLKAIEGCIKYVPY